MDRKVGRPKKKKEQERGKWFLVWPNQEECFEFQTRRAAMEAAEQYSNAGNLIGDDGGPVYLTLGLFELQENRILKVIPLPIQEKELQYELQCGGL